MNRIDDDDTIVSSNNAMVIMKNTTLGSARFWWLAPVCAGLMASCSFAGDAPGDAPGAEADRPDTAQQQVIYAEPVGPVDYYDDVYEVSDQIAADASTDGDTLRIPVDRAGELAQREAGEIVFSNLEGHHFRLRIEQIDQFGDELVLRGMTPDLDEVVEHGTFRATFGTPRGEQTEQHRQVLAEDPAGTGQFFDMNQRRFVDEPPDHTGETARLTQGLTDDEAFSEFWYYDNLNLGDPGEGVELQEGVLDVRPGIVVEWTVSGGTPGDFELDFDGDIDVSMDWLVDSDGTVDFEDATGLQPMDGELVAAGSVDHELYGSMHITADFAASGSGEFEQNFAASGSVDAVASESMSSWQFDPDRHFIAANSTDASGQLDDAEATVSVDLNFELVSLATGSPGVPVLELTPASLQFDSATDIDVPECPWQAQIDVHSSGQILTGATTGLTTGSETVLDQLGTVGGVDECRPDFTSHSCDSDAACPDLMVCTADEDDNTDGDCIADADVEIQLSWQDPGTPADLGLYVWTPNQELIAYEKNEQGTDALLVDSSCGGCNDDSGDFGDFQYHERVLYDGVDSGDQFKIWVANEQSGGVDTPADRLDFNLSLTQEDGEVFDDTFTGSLGTGEGDESVIYVYTAP